MVLVFIKVVKHVGNEDVLKIANLLICHPGLWLINDENFENLRTGVTFQLHPDIPQAAVFPVLLVALFITFFLVTTSFGQNPKVLSCLTISLPINSSAFFFN